MRTASTLCLAMVLFVGVSCQRLLQHIPEVGLGPLVQVGGDTSGRFSGSDDDGSTIEEDLVEALEADDQVTVVGSVELGELLCKSLAEAEDAAALSFLVLNEERVVAERTAYGFTAGDIFTDSVGRHVWTGVIIDPVQAEDEAVPRTVSMSWGEVCSVETFLLKVTKQNADGTVTLIKTVPCDEFGIYTCLVEVLIEFEESDEVILPEDDATGPPATSSAAASVSSSGTSSVNTGRTETTSPSERRRAQESDDTVIDVMILYSEEAMISLGGISHAQMQTTIVESLASTNAAFVNSELALTMNAVHIGELPFEETADDSAVTLPMIRLDADVNDLRDFYGADLVQMIGGKMTQCGRGYLFFSESYGYSIAKATCLDNFSHTHEYGHNLGCNHDRNNTVHDFEYAHGVQYCDFPEYRTIMAYSCELFTPRVNYFSNPDISVLGRVTGTPTEDNARVIRDNMVAVSNYRNASSTTPSPAASATPAPEASATPTPLALPTPGPSDLATPTPVDLPTPGPSGFATPTPVASPTPGPSDLATPTPVAPPTPGPSDLATPIPVALPTPAPSDLATPTPVAIPSPAPFALSTPAPSSLATPSPVVLPTPAPVALPSPGPTPVATPTPVDLGTPAPSALGSPAPSALGTPAPLAVPTPSPSGLKTSSPVVASTPGPVVPSVMPSIPTSTTVAPVATLPAFSDVGCYGDDAGNRVLSGDYVKGDEDMTTEKCAFLCEGYAYFGTEFGNECFCGSSSDNPKRLGPTKCDFSCAGDASETCGGRNAISVYWYETTYPYPSVGCFKDLASNRVLSGKFVKDHPTMTTKVCADLCEGSPYFGTEYGEECFCGIRSDNPAELGGATCDFECAGNPSETCGGRNAISVYEYPDLPVVTAATYLGCWGDSKDDRIMGHVQSDNDMTNSLCQSLCRSNPFYGTQYGIECWCGDGKIDHTIYGPSDSCDYECSGDPTQTCGGYNAMSVWEF